MIADFNFSMKYSIYIALLFLLVTKVDAQPNTIPYPIIFVHGLVGGEDTFIETADTLQRILNLNRAKVFHVCLNHDQDSTTASLNSFDVYEIGWTNFGGSIPTIPTSDDRLFIINFNSDDFQFVNNHGNHRLSNQSAIYKQGYALSMAIWSVLQNTGASKVILVGHSMGGLAAREYLQRTNDGTNSSPHTWWIDPNSPVDFTPLLRQFLG